jgi:hypothetical protein
MKKIVRNIICNTVYYSFVACLVIIASFVYVPLFPDWLKGESDWLECEWDPHQEKGDRLRILYDGEVLTVGELISMAFIVFLLALMIAVMTAKDSNRKNNEDKPED